MSMDYVYFYISPKTENDINGIIHQIKSIPVSAYASSVNGGNNSTRGPQLAIDSSVSTFWASINWPNQWIVINFTINIHITHYSVQSYSSSDGLNYPKKWKVDAILDSGWINIDNVDSSKINSELTVETRKITNNGPFSAFRFTSTGTNWDSNDYFVFPEVDFFGYNTFPSQCRTNMGYFSHHLATNNIYFLIAILVKL